MLLWLRRNLVRSLVVLEEANHDHSKEWLEGKIMVDSINEEWRKLWKQWAILVKVLDLPKFKVRKRDKWVNWRELLASLRGYRTLNS